MNHLNCKIMKMIIRDRHIIFVLKISQHSMEELCCNTGDNQNTWLHVYGFGKWFKTFFQFQFKRILVLLK